MKVSTAVNHQNRFIERLRSAYGSAKCFSWTATELSERTLAIRSTPEYKRSPRHVQEYVRGYGDALWDALWNQMVSVFVSLETGLVYIGKYPESPCVVTFLGHAWPKSEPGNIYFYTKRGAEDIEEERTKRNIKIKE